MTSYLIQYRKEINIPNRIITCDRLKVEKDFAFFVANSEPLDNKPGKLLLLVNINNIIDISLYEPVGAAAPVDGNAVIKHAYP
jgi:hypothetical protein